MQRASTILVPGLLAAGVLAGVCAFAGMGANTSVAGGVAAVIGVLVGSVPALAYVIASAGLGRLAGPVLSGSSRALSLQCAVGLALMLSLSHALGWAGAFGGPAGRLVAILPLALGLALAGQQVMAAARDARLKRTSPGAGSATEGWAGVLDPVAVLVGPGVALLLVAACQPPGWLWSTEFGAYDALSYHLALPQEWMAGGRLRPLEHNVYSYLPSYVEAAFLHLGVAMGGGRAPAAGTIGSGLLAGDGAPALACQVLHALLTVLAAGLTGSLASLVAGRERVGDVDPAVARRAEGLAFAVGAGMVLLTPWSIVVGSLAYNEMAMLALLAGALVAALDDGLSAARRGMLTGLLVGVACGAKPTALIFAGAPAAIALLGSLPARQWTRAAAAGAGLGLAALAPWMVRNALASGNPVFPFAAGVFGPGHWTMEQVQRYRGAHRFDGSLAERVRLLVAEEPLKIGQRDLGPSRHRGAMHPQYFAFFPLALLAALGAALTGSAGAKRGAAPGVLLALGLVSQVAAWMFTTHLQSRFLLPLVVPGAALMGAQAVGLLSLGVPAWVARACGAIALSAQLGAAGFIFSLEQRRAPNGMLALGPGYSSGSLFLSELSGADPAQRAAAMRQAPFTAAVNLLLTGRGAGGGGGALYLLGDATPFYFTVPVVYHTTYDRSPLGEAMRRAPGDPAAWTRELRAGGVRYVLYCPGEIARLRASGWYDPEVTTGAAEDWLSRCAIPVRAWPEAGRALFELRDLPRGEPGP